MNKNEIIDAVLACRDWDGITATGVFTDKFVALCRVLPAYRDKVEAAPVAAPADYAAAIEPAVVEAPVEPAA